jgi:dipeptidyl aminopeptidase/acylaminoacyl peptidase
MTARVWDARTGQPISAPLRHFGLVYTAAFSRDGTRLVTACGDGSARVWDLPVTTTADGPLIADAAEAVSGYRVGETGSLIALNDAAARLQALRGAAAAAVPGRTSAAALLRWVFEDPWQRSISPRSPLTASDYVLGRLSVCTPIARAEAAWHFPGHALLRTGSTTCSTGVARDPSRSY